MSLSTMNLGASGFFLDVTLDEVEEEFISSFHGLFRKEGVDTVYPKLYWQIVNVPLGIKRIGNIAFALDVDGSTEPFTSLYDISRGVYCEQVAKAMKVIPADTSHNLLVLNGLNSDNAEPIDDNVIALAIKEIERVQKLDSGLTGYFTDSDDQESQKFISCLIKGGFQTLNYNGFVSQEATMVFRPFLHESALQNKRTESMKNHSDKTNLAIKVINESYATFDFGAGLLSGDVASFLGVLAEEPIDHDLLTRKTALNEWPNSYSKNEGLTSAVFYMQDKFKKLNPSSYCLSLKDVIRSIELANGDLVTIEELTILA